MNRPTPPAPREPSADMRVAASGLHQLYTALTNEGFTEQQALVIIGQMIAAQMLGGQQQ